MTCDDAKMMIELLAEMVRSDKELKEFFVKEMSRACAGPQRDMIPLKEAASRLGLSTAWLYKNKAAFSCKKTGNAKSSTVMFNASTLHQEYQAFIESRKKIIPITLARKIM
jgi:hypothetical protein